LHATAPKLKTALKHAVKKNRLCIWEIGGSSDKVALIREMLNYESGQSALPSLITIMNRSQSGGNSGTEIPGRQPVCWPEPVIGQSAGYF
jgi:hypothetical protein